MLQDFISGERCISHCSNSAPAERCTSQCSTFAPSSPSPLPWRQGFVVNSAVNQPGCVDPLLPKFWQDRARRSPEPGRPQSLAEGLDRARCLAELGRPPGLAEGLGCLSDDDRPKTAPAGGCGTAGWTAEGRRQLPAAAHDGSPPASPQVARPRYFAVDPRPFPEAREVGRTPRSVGRGRDLPALAGSSARIEAATVVEDWETQTIAALASGGAGPKMQLCVLELGRPDAVWMPKLWQEARDEVLERGSSACLTSLFHIARDATALALQRGFYTLQKPRAVRGASAMSPGHATSTGHEAPRPCLPASARSSPCHLAVERFDFGPVQALWPTVQWFGRRSIELTLPEIDAASVPPPLIVTTLDALDVAATLRNHSKIGSRRIYMTAELCAFTDDGRPDTSRRFSVHPRCLTVRTDFSRYLTSVDKSAKLFRSTPQQHLQAEQDPYVFICPDVCVFRGERNEGYPFSRSAFSVHVVGASTSQTRPAVQSVPGRSGATRWYAKKADHTSLVERLNLIGMAALQSAQVESRARREGCSEEQPVLIIPALGFGGDQFHPRDAFANSLKQWRRRFCPFFHSVFVCCTSRGSPDTELAMHLDKVVNKNIFRIPNSEQLAHQMARWHWEPLQMGMSVSAGRMQLAALHCQSIAGAASTDPRRQAERPATSSAKKRAIGEARAGAGDEAEEQVTITCCDGAQVADSRQMAPKNSSPSSSKQVPFKYSSRVEESGSDSNGASDGEFDMVPETTSSGFNVVVSQMAVVRGSDFDSEKAVEFEKKKRSIKSNMSSTNSTPSMTHDARKEFMRSVKKNGRIGSGQEERASMDAMRSTSSNKAGRSSSPLPPAAEAASSPLPLPPAVEAALDDGFSDSDGEVCKTKTAPPAFARKADSDAGMDATGSHTGRRRISATLREACLAGMNVPVQVLHPIDQGIILREQAKTEQVLNNKRASVEEVVGSWNTAPAATGARCDDEGKRRSSAGKSHIKALFKEKQEGISFDAALDIRKKARDKLRCSMDGSDGAGAAMGRSCTEPAAASHRGRRLSYKDVAEQVSVEAAAAMAPTSSAGRGRRHSVSDFEQNVHKEVAQAMFQCEDLFTQLDEHDDDKAIDNEASARAMATQVGALADDLASKLEAIRHSSVGRSR